MAWWQILPTISLKEKKIHTFIMQFCWTFHFTWNWILSVNIEFWSKFWWTTKILFNKRIKLNSSLNSGKQFKHLARSHLAPKNVVRNHQTPLNVNKRISTLLWFPFEVAYFMHIFLFRAPFFAQLKQRYYVFPLAIFQIRSHTCSYEIVSVYSRGCSFGEDLLVLFSPNWF